MNTSVGLCAEIKFLDFLKTLLILEAIINENYHKFIIEIDQMNWQKSVCGKL